MAPVNETTVDAAIERLKALIGVMKAEGISVATLADGTSATLGARPAAPAKPVVPQKACECSHHLARHTADGTCLERQPNGAPCLGKCRIIEGSN